MEEADYATTFNLEEENWWFVGMRRISLEMIGRARDHSGGDNVPVVVDLGCGTGMLLDHLNATAPAIGIDLSSTALGFCGNRSIDRLIKADGSRLPLADNSVDLLTAIGVIEHIDSDLVAVRDWARVLKPGGSLILLTSSYKWLWSGHDVSNHHVRRYRRKDVARLLADAGLEPIQVSYVNSLLFPGIAFVRLLERIRRRGASPAPKKNVAAVPPFANRFLIGILALEARLLRNVSLPYGVSMVASATKGGPRSRN